MSTSTLPSLALVSTTPLLDEDRPGLIAYRKSRGLGSGQENLPVPLEEVTQQPIDVDLYRRDLESRGIPPSDAQVRLGRTVDPAYTLGMAQALAGWLTEVAAMEWAQGARRLCRAGERRRRIAIPWRWVTTRIGAIAVVWTAIATGVTTWLVVRGVELTATNWAIGIVAIVLGVAAGIIALDRWQREIEGDAPIPDSVWNQSILALEIASSQPMISRVMTDLDQAVAAGYAVTQARTVRDELVARWAELTVVYEAECTRAVTEAGREGRAAWANGARARAVSANVVDNVGPVMDGEVGRRSIGERLGLVVLSVLTVGGVTAVGTAGLNAWVAASKCSIAQAQVRIEACPDLTGLPAAGLDLTGVRLDGRDLTGSEFSGAVLTDASLAKANLANASLSGTRLDGASLAEASLEGADHGSADLKDANLSRVQAGNLRARGAFLVGAKLENGFFRQADLGEATLSDAKASKGDFTYGLLHGIKATGADFRDAVFSGADLSGADLSGAKLDRAKLTEVDLTAATLTGASLNQADLTGSDLSGVDLGGISLRDVVLEGASLREANLQGASLEGARLAGASLDGAKIEGLSLKGADLEGVSVAALLDGKANLEGAILEKANFSGLSATAPSLKNASLAGVNLAGLDLRKADLSGADLSNADLSGADLRGAVLVGTKLDGANLTQADVSEGNLSGASLSGANLTELRAMRALFPGARLSGAVLTGADFAGSDFAGAQGIGSTTSRAFWRGATCPDGGQAEDCR